VAEVVQEKAGAEKSAPAKLGVWKYDEKWERFSLDKKEPFRAI
jgi:hypothetical protein